MSLFGLLGMFYILMEAILKPAMKAGMKYYRQQFVTEPVGEQGKEEQDALYTKRLHSSFRVASILIGILYVWGSGTDVSFFDVFGRSSGIANQELLNVITTGAAIGLGSRGTHFLVDVAESVMRFSLVRLAPNDPEVV